jgi:predicted Zn-dependent protease
MIRVALLAALLPLTASAQYSAAQDMERQSTVVADQAIVQYVDRIAQKLAQAANLKSPLTAKVIAGDRSYAIPGASCYVSTKLILTAVSEAELAGAIAHLLGHLALWDSNQRLDSQSIGQIPLIFYAGCVRLSAGALAIPMQLGDRQAALESQADKLGLGYLDKAGYDPGALADFFERTLSQVRKPGVFNSWTKFPAATRTQADSLRTRGNNFVMTTSEFSGIQQRVSALGAASVRADAPSLQRERVVPEVEHEVNLIRDPIVVDYVNRIARKLVTSAALEVPLTVKVIVSGSLHTITVPEGVTYLTTGLILSASSEAELAGAIAHQLGHLADPHAEAAGPNGLCLRPTTSFQSEAEEQADLQGLEYMDKAGYDPAALADFFERMLQPAGSLPAATRARAGALRNHRDFVLTTSEFRDVRQRLVALAQ